MGQHKLDLVCWHPACAADPVTTLMVDIPDGPRSNQTKRALKYCKRNHPNMVTLPATWDSSPLILGDPPPGTPRHRPTVRGEKPG